MSAENVEMKNRCYNCAKFLNPDRTCFSDGECPNFDPGPSDSEIRMTFRNVRRNEPETECDRCERAAECYKEGRLIAYTSLADVAVYPEFGRNGHVMLGFSECPKK